MIRAALVLAFVVVPLLEIAVLLQVGAAIGGWNAVAVLLAVSLIGAWLVRREGSRAWRGLRTAMGSGQLPGREVADAALVLVGGTLLLTPGFVTDAVGLLLVLPVTRPLARRLLLHAAVRRVQRAAASGPLPGAGPVFRTRASARVVEGEVVGDDDGGPGRDHRG